VDLGSYLAEHPAEPVAIDDADVLEVEDLGARPPARRHRAA
jgi:hypothetical protein